MGAFHSALLGTLQPTFAIGAKAKQATFDASGLTANRTVTVPDIAGTLALLQGSQTFTGGKTFQGGLTVGGPGASSSVGIELGATDGATATTPYIDFHAGATVVDYDARIVASSGTGAVGGGSLDFYAGGLGFHAPATFDDNIAIAGNLTVNPFTIAGTLTGNGRTVKWDNNDTSAGNAMSLNLLSGATGNGQVTQFGTEYTAVVALAGRTLLENTAGNGVMVSALAASTDIQFAVGSTRTIKMRVASAGNVFVGGTANTSLSTTFHTLVIGDRPAADGAAVLLFNPTATDPAGMGLTYNSGAGTFSLNDWSTAGAPARVTFGQAGGMVFAQTLASSATDLTKQIQLWAGYGFSITSNTLNLVAASKVFAFGSDGSLTMDGDVAGYLGVKYANKTAAYTFTTADRDKGAAKNTSTAITFTLPTAGTEGDVYPFANINATGNLTIAPGTGGTCRLAGTTSTGSRTVAPWGIGSATCVVTSASAPVWLVAGAGVT